MPLDRLARTRVTLPEGYQFGDARRQPSVTGRSGATFLFDDETSAARFAERVRVDGRADRPSPPGGDREPGPTWRPPHVNAAEQLERRGWNVIEGEHFESDAERHPAIEGAES